MAKKQDTTATIVDLDSAELIATIKSHRLPTDDDQTAALDYEIAVQMAELASMTSLPESYTLAIGGESPSLIAAVVQAELASKVTGSVIVILDAYGSPVRTITPAGRRGGGSGGMTGPRGADWSSKSGRAIKAMMAVDASGKTVGATMDEMKEITGWSFGQKYVDQLQRSFGVRIWTVDATARVKRTWHAALATDMPADATDSVDTVDHDVDAAADLAMAG